MPEIKHTFTTGRMNKDLDERLVPNGQYRDAMNIQVRTTDGDSDGLGDAGTVQNIQGNAQLPGGSSYLTTGYDTKTTQIVGSVADEKNDVAYFFAAAPTPNDGIENLLVSEITPVSGTTNEVVWVDTIIEARTNGDTSVPIFVDKFAVTGTATDVFTGTDTESPPNGTTTAFTNFEVGGGNGSKYRAGMIIYAQEADGDHLLFTDTDETTPSIEGVRITKIVGDVIYLASRQTTNLSTAIVFKFVHPERVLEFDYEKLITGINVLDKLLFWTDGNNEPKKINIERSERGTNIGGTTNNGTTHTQLFVNDPESGDLVNINTIEELENGDIKKEHIIVIKKKPTTVPTLIMRESDRPGDTTFVISDPPFVSGNYIPNTPVAGTDHREIVFPNDVDVREGDVFTFTEDVGVNPVVLRGQVVTNGLDEFPTVKLLMVFVDENLNGTEDSFIVKLEQSNALFEDKFGRFAYRYKYEDNEYSAFSPWSELAFLPGNFLYTQSKGFNDGMENHLRYLSVNNFIPDDSIRPSDVKAIDILWKTSDDQNVYVVKSIKRKIDEEWSLLNQGDTNKTGSLVITSDIIERALPSNQLIRTWDNVPRSAIAQETTANRIVYGNYLQGYDMSIPVGVKQSLNSSKIMSLIPKKSIKSLRDYKVGMVFGDKYGRETPVIANGYNAINNETVTGDISITKNRSHLKNSFSLLPNWEDVGEPLEWMDYIKYYIKETSDEYYNLIMDRWYDAKDGNVWVSFPSADRNKIDEETYLILKNEQGSQTPVEEKARYKVIAIENEAPDYVKLNERKFTRVPIDKKGVYNVANDDNSITDGIPVGLYGKREITTDRGFWESINIKRSDFKGTPKVRIVADWYNAGTPTIGFTAPAASFEGPWNTVSQIIRPVEDADTDRPGVALETEFKIEEVNAHAYFTNDLAVSGLDTEDVDNLEDPDYIYYYMEFADDVPQSKAEFDGRFFVKIEADDVLRTRVINKSIADGEYVNIPGKSYDICYISSKYTNPAEDDPTNDGTYNEISWDNLTDGGITDDTYGANTESVFSNSNIEDDFGINDTSTETFWALWDEYSKSSSGTRIFIDNANTRTIEDYNEGNGFYYGVQNTEGAVNWEIDYISPITGEDESDLPIGLGSTPSIEQQNPNEKDYFIFSVVHNEDGSFPSAVSEFFSKMRMVGTQFRIGGDPTGSIYEVINNSYWAAYGEGPYAYSWPTVYTTNMVMTSKNFVGGEQSLRKRQSIITVFGRVNLATNNVEAGTGIDVTNWDPRGSLRHDGRNSIKINLVEYKSTEDILDVAVTTGSACFETEPKQSKDLDIYYEASRAIPLKLNKDNIQNFTGASNIISNASTITMDNRQLANGIEEVNLPACVIAEAFGDKYIKLNYIVNEELSNVTVDIVGNSANGIAINDIINFENRDGTVTRSKIIDHRSTVMQDGDALTSIPSSRTENVDGVVGTNAQDANAGLIYVTETLAGFNQDLDPEGDTTLAGYEVIGTNIQPGTFVIAVFFGSLFIISKPPISSVPTVVDDLKFIQVTGRYEIDQDVYKYSTDLGWFNCYSFGNGVESDRIRDDFNTPQIDNGCRVSSIFLEYGEERISSGLIHSGLFNSISSVNNLNEFNMGEKITKNLNPSYGSIQALKTRENNIVVFSEDKVLRVLANKDAVFNADGNPQLVATNRVLGDATPFVGEYGISKNPESLAADQYRIYFTDKQRGAVLRLSNDGLTPISNVGMRTYFRENLKSCDTIVGTFDAVNGEYNATLNIKDVLQTTEDQPTTVSFNEGSKGWVSFKSFIPLTGVSVNGKYLTAKNNKIYEHYLDVDSNGTTVGRNSFYGINTVESEVEIVFNDSPGSIKSFKTVNYEGSQSRIILNLEDDNYYNLSASRGWYVDSFNTDMQEGGVTEFIKKENKWFNKINGLQTTLSNLDASEFSVQGIGFPDVAQYGIGSNDNATITIQDTGDTP